MKEQTAQMENEPSEKELPDRELSEKEISQNIISENEISGKDLSIEEAFEQISKLLAQMEQEDCSLEDSFKCYEEGMKLIRYCNGRIDRVEKKVLALNADGELDEF